MQDFRKLQVWKKSHQLVLKVYGVTSRFRREEMYGLTSQIRRSSTSIPTNIAEGCGRKSAADFARFLYISMGSASESEYLVLLSYDLKLLSSEEFEDLTATVIEIKKMLTSLINKLKTDD